MNTVADLRVSTVRQDAGRQRPAILKHARSEGLSVDAIAGSGVTFIAIKENIRFKGERDIQTKVMTTMFSLFAEVERDLISERTREGLVNARASAKKLGRPKRSLAPGVSRLDGKEHEIRRFLELGISKTAIAKITGVSWSTLNNFMASRSVKLKP